MQCATRAEQKKAHVKALLNRLELERLPVQAVLFVTWAAFAKDRRMQKSNKKAQEEAVFFFLSASQQFLQATVLQAWGRRAARRAFPITKRVAERDIAKGRSALLELVVWAWANGLKAEAESRRLNQQKENRVKIFLRNLAMVIKQFQALVFKLWKDFVKARHAKKSKRQERERAVVKEHFQVEGIVLQAWCRRVALHTLARSERVASHCVARRCNGLLQLVLRHWSDKVNLEVVSKRMDSMQCAARAEQTKLQLALLEHLALERLPVQVAVFMTWVNFVDGGRRGPVRNERVANKLVANFRHVLLGLVFWKWFHDAKVEAMSELIDSTQGEVEGWRVQLVAISERLTEDLAWQGKAALSKRLALENLLVLAVVFKALAAFVERRHTQRTNKKEREEAVMKQFSAEQLFFQAAVLQAWGRCGRTFAATARVANGYIAKGSKALLQVTLRLWAHSVKIDVASKLMCNLREKT
jgi:hypothetical protein